MGDQPQGTEYTLQGIMRFLQLEWHAHERARNAWDIERAELKAKIAKQEGDCRSSKKINESLTKQIRMLEKVLKQERARNRAIEKGEQIPSEEDLKKEWGGKIGLTSSSKASEQDPSNPTADREAQRDKSKEFLQRCVDELTYILTPPSHPTPAMLDSHDHPSDIPADLYYDPQAYGDRQKRSFAGPPQLPTLPNHLAPVPAPQRHPTEYYNPQSLHRAVPAAPPTFVHQPDHQVDLSTSGPVTHVEELPERIPPTGMSRSEVSNPHSNNNSGASFEEYPQRYDSYSNNNNHPKQLPMNETTSYARPDDVGGWDFDDGQEAVQYNGRLSDVPRSGHTRDTEVSVMPVRPDNESFPISMNASAAKSPPRAGRRRRSSGSIGGSQRRRSDDRHEIRDLSLAYRNEDLPFKVRFALRGHLDVVRSVIFSGGGSPSEPEICTTSDDGTIKRWIIPSGYGIPALQGAGGPPQNTGHDLDVAAYFTHRGHDGIVTCLAACPTSSNIATGGRALGDGWIFSGGTDATVRVWERGRVDCKATIEGHTDAIWALCVLPGNAASVFGSGSPPNSANTAIASSDRMLLVSGSADGRVKVWAVTCPPPALSSPSSGAPGSRRGVGGTRRHSVTSGSSFPSSPQPSMASGTNFESVLVHDIVLPENTSSLPNGDDVHENDEDKSKSPTSIVPLGSNGESFIVSYNDSSVVIFDTRTGEQIIQMASAETYDGTPGTAVNSVVVANSFAGSNMPTNNSVPEVSVYETGSTGEGVTDDKDLSASSSIVNGIASVQDGGDLVVISGHEDRYVRFFDVNSGQCTYSMLAHPSSIASLSASPDGRELVTAGHDASLRFWSLEKRASTQEITSHRVCRGEGVVSVVWSQDGRWVVSGGGDGVVKVFSR